MCRRPATRWQRATLPPSPHRNPRCAALAQAPPRVQPRVPGRPSSLAGLVLRAARAGRHAEYGDRAGHRGRSERTGARDMDGPAGRLDHGPGHPRPVRPRGQRAVGVDRALRAVRRAVPATSAPARFTRISRCVLAFSVSYAFFGAGNLDISVPSAYPLLAYLLARMLWVAFRAAASAADPTGSPAERAAARARVPARLSHRPERDERERDRRRLRERDRRRPPASRGWAVQRFSAGHSARRHVRAGGVRRLRPFVLAFPWGGSWDALPAAHAAALAFDLACVAGMWLAGRRLGGGTLGLLFAYLWVACPFTLLVSNSGPTTRWLPRWSSRHSSAWVARSRAARCRRRRGSRSSRRSVWCRCS